MSQVSPLRQLVDNWTVDQDFAKFRLDNLL